MSPGSSRRERTTASAGAFSSPCEIWCRSSASWACVACNWASAPAMSSLRGPASARRSASRCSSAWAWATCAALRARSMSWALTPRPCVLAAMPRSRQVLLGTRRVGLRGDEPAARLGDFLGTRAVAQAQQRLLLRVHLRPRLIGLQRQRARPARPARRRPHAVALFGAQFLHAAIAVEGQRDLADVHVAVVDEIAAAVALAVAPAPQAAATGRDGGDEDDGLFHGGDSRGRAVAGGSRSALGSGRRINSKFKLNLKSTSRKIAAYPNTAGIQDS